MNEVQCPSIVGFTLESLITPCDETNSKCLSLNWTCSSNFITIAKTILHSARSHFPRLLSQACPRQRLLAYMKLPASHPEVRDSLVRWGANVNFQHSYSVSPSPLATAVRANNLDNVRWLLSVNADVNLVTDGWTPVNACVLPWSYGYCKISPTTWGGL
ncbi:hypothetical protein DL96DRAFT_349674 [Flagelloscypha sp. PMI_526]|nr:hypothetical protein DL96DRAFT_349674 [Flagelloscypha sp. PMI_526]